MSQKAISMLIIRTMLQLLQRSGSERSIAAELNMSRNTLRKYDAAFKASPYSYKELLAMDDTTLSEIVYPGTRPITDDDAPLKDPRLEAFEALRDHFLKELKRTGVTNNCFGRNTWSNIRMVFAIPNFASDYDAMNNQPTYPYTLLISQVIR
jgi:hypothetical protein